MEREIEGRCHCGAVGFSMALRPEDATICNCSVCRRYGTIWAYGWLDHDIWVDDPGERRHRYVRGDREIGFHHCATCGCVTDWTGLKPMEHPAFAGQGARTRIAVNLRLVDAAQVAKIPLRLFDGADKFVDLPVDGRCIADIVV